jgi:hypothetical protein
MKTVMVGCSISMMTLNIMMGSPGRAVRNVEARRGVGRPSTKQRIIREKRGGVESSGYCVDDL